VTSAHPAGGPAGPAGRSSGGLRLRSLIVVGIISSCVAIALLVAAVDPSRTLAVIRQATREPLALGVGILSVQETVTTNRATGHRSRMSGIASMPSPSGR
jgi:hypothetical protein